MVRPLLPRLVTLPQHLCSLPNHTLALAFVLLAIFSVLSIIALLCASHNKAKNLKSRRSQPCLLSSNGREKRLFPGFTGNIGASGKALLKMVSWRRVQDDNEEEEEEEVLENVDDGKNDDVVWRKAIIMGGRCRPLDFSGKIEYDCEGNPLPSDDGERVVKTKDITITGK